MTYSHPTQLMVSAACHPEGIHGPLKSRICADVEQYEWAVFATYSEKMGLWARRARGICSVFV